MSREEAFTREHFRFLIGWVRAHGAFPDDPLLAVYDELRAQLAQVTAERDKWAELAGSFMTSQHQYLRDMESLKVQLAEVMVERDAAVAIRAGYDAWLTGGVYCTTEEYDLEIDAKNILKQQLAERDATIRALYAQWEAAISALRHHNPGGRWQREGWADDAIAILYAVKTSTALSLDIDAANPTTRAPTHAPASTDDESEAGPSEYTPS
jgi:hypothetical protein